MRIKVKTDIRQIDLPSTRDILDALGLMLAGVAVTAGIILAIGVGP